MLTIPHGFSRTAHYFSPTRHPSWSRGSALMLAVFTWINLLGEQWRPGFDANSWWIDTSAIPGMASDAMLWLGALALSVVACGFRMTWGVRLGVRVVVLGLLAVTLYNAAVFYALWIAGDIKPGVPLPVSLFITGLLLLVFSKHRLDRTNRRQLIATGVVAAGLLIAFAVGQMFCFGQTDYRRPADAAVVFGCRAYADGSPSDALADRVLTACSLYTTGVVDTLIFSGGPGDGDVHEVEAMRRLAVQQGVAAHDILLDRHGLNTQHTVDHTTALFAQHGFTRVLAVSHAYHLPRIKMTYQRAGFEVYTVPAEERYTLTAMPYMMAREVAAWWKYFLDPLRA